MHSVAASHLGSLACSLPSKHFPNWNTSMLTMTLLLALHGNSQAPAPGLLAGTDPDVKDSLRTHTSSFHSYKDSPVSSLPRAPVDVASGLEAIQTAIDMMNANQFAETEAMLQPW